MKTSVPQFLKTHYQHHPRFWIILLAILLALILIKNIISGLSKNHRIVGLPVVVATAHTADVPIYLSALGTVTPTYSVTVRTQINGQLLRVLFHEGQIVKAGDLLAEIDPRPYLAQLEQYEGQLTRDQALLANAEMDLKRYTTLWKQNSVAKQTLDTQQSVVDQNKGTVKLDEGLVASIKVNLLYTRITSPIDGRIGLRLVDPGNFVQTSDTSGIAVINMLNPITVIFSIPQDDIDKVARQTNASKKLIVKAYDREQVKLLATGSLITIDNQIDPTTGTVKLKALFDNRDNALFPNQFVNIQLLVTTLKNATVIPTAAIQYGVNNHFVYLVKNDQTVTATPVTVGAAMGNDTAITKGISPGQIVVIEGADKLTEGAKVTVNRLHVGWIRCDFCTVIHQINYANLFGGLRQKAPNPPYNFSHWASLQYRTATLAIAIPSLPHSLPSQWEGRARVGRELWCEKA